MTRGRPYFGKGMGTIDGALCRSVVFWSFGAVSRVWEWSLFLVAFHFCSRRFCCAVEEMEWLYLGWRGSGPLRCVSIVPCPPRQNEHRFEGGRRVGVDGVLLWFVFRAFLFLVDLLDFSASTVLVCYTILSVSALLFTSSCSACVHSLLVFFLKDFCFRLSGLFLQKQCTTQLYFFALTPVLSVHCRSRYLPYHRLPSAFVPVLLSIHFHATFTPLTLTRPPPQSQGLDIPVWSIYLY